MRLSHDARVEQPQERKVDDVDAHCKGVITSYSIHYTKLYDIYGTSFEKEVANRITSYNVCYTKLLRSGTSTATLKIPDTGQTRCYDSEGMEINCRGTGQDRITSYNVCYTKLLRPEP